MLDDIGAVPSTPVTPHRAPLHLSTRARAYVRSFTGISSNARHLLVATTCLWVGIGISGVLFNLYLIAIGYNVAFVGVLAAVSTVGQASMSPVLGRLLRRWPARVVMLVATLLAAITMALAAIFTQAAPLVVATAIQGAAIAAASIPASPFIMEQSTLAQRAPLFSAYTAAANLGSMVGSLLSGVVPALTGVLPALRGQMLIADRLGLLLGAAITALGVWWYLKITNERVVDEEPGLTRTLRREKPVDDGKAQGDVVAMMAATALIAIALGVIYPLFNVYFATVYNASTATIGLLYAISSLACTVGALLGPLAARQGNLSGLVILRLFSAPMLLVFWMQPGLAIASVAYISRNILGTVTGILENTFAMEIIPARLRGAVASWRAFAFSAGWTAGSLIAGVVVARYGFDVVFVASTILTLAGSLTWYQRFGHRGSIPRFPLHSTGSAPHEDGPRSAEQAGA